ncbi:hypothetical protein Pmar_PMAR010539 [Perkinsus marinus ATCC 50983]|uniref:Uncharacterized protein n=1 Tax=Perkinsus marinus (strain ATCC 50983 / TXsc) TaxID=423536 RepID=C5KMH3_PERM5|nr:hypothetical protein Pmar_PMAR010539 [Perkinsus marinus ATCC 50983]EER14321.1 hypothetical protein Pmar_PMAR010539 [Perkinsus marinus ATCC 50983]|eukprot:XP_002782526.1 hypothetical protein Pmar_PMAR010539 [Perkinsus marinus ATCC 50983]
MFADRTVKVPVRDLSLWLNTLEAGGQHTPYRKFSALSTPELREELQKALSDRGVTCSIEETGKYLGVNLRFSGGSLVLVCERLARLNQAADKAEEILKSSSFTRREIFGLAGLLGCGWNELGSSLLVGCFDSYSVFSGYVTLVEMGY